jgi:hypothetical protein
METQLTDTKTEQIILEDKSQYFYTVKPFEITNALGAIIDTLMEYSISNMSTQNYKLYRTKDGNWYDVPKVNPTADNVLLMSLKLAINSKKNRDLK